VGTAIYLYGEASQGEYTIELDGTQTTPASSAPGLLFSQSNLAYGSHTLVLQVVKSGATISNATITVGMGQAGYVSLSLKLKKEAYITHHHPAPSYKTAP
jgi:hypothetical protein